MYPRAPPFVDLCGPFIRCVESIEDELIPSIVSRVEKLEALEAIEARSSRTAIEGSCLHRISELERNLDVLSRMERVTDPPFVPTAVGIRVPNDATPNGAYNIQGLAALSTPVHLRRDFSNRPVFDIPDPAPHLQPNWSPRLLAARARSSFILAARQRAFSTAQERAHHQVMLDRYRDAYFAVDNNTQAAQPTSHHDGPTAHYDMLSNMGASTWDEIYGDHTVPNQVVTYIDDAYYTSDDSDPGWNAAQ